MESARSKIVNWLIVYEVTYIATFSIVGIILLCSSKASPVESITFIKSHNMLDDVLHIWLNNTTSFLIAAVLIILHPVLGVLNVAFTSIFSSELLASWLSGYCSTVHFFYGNIETQAYIILWLTVARTYYAHQECNSLFCRWETTLEFTGKLLLYTFTTFLVLAIVEVVEVNAIG